MASASSRDNRWRAEEAHGFLFGFMHEAVFSMYSYRTRGTDMTRRGFDESLMPVEVVPTMFDCCTVSPYTGRVIAATDAGAKVMFDETYFARGSPTSANDWSVNARSDIVAVPRTWTGWNQSSGTVGNRTETPSWACEMEG